MKRVIASFLIFATGLAVGCLLAYGGLFHQPSPFDPQWKQWHKAHDDQVHRRIVDLQNATTAPVVGNACTVDDQIKAQSDIEDLIVKSQQAEHTTVGLYGGSIAALITAVFSGLVQIYLFAFKD